MKTMLLITTLVLIIRSSYGAFETPTVEVERCTRRSFSDENGTTWTLVALMDSNYNWGPYCLGNIEYNAYGPSKFIQAVSGTIPDELVIPLENQGEAIGSIEPAAFQFLPVKSVIFQHKTIPYGAFRECTNLTKISLPDTLKTIGSYAFYGCRSLKSITIPQSVTSIEEGAFSGCQSLKSITIPQSVTSIGEGAFDSLKFDELCVSSSPKGWNKNVFGTSPLYIKLFRCPSEYLEEWRSYFATASITPLKIETELATIKAVTTLDNGGTLSFRNKQQVKGETASITATPKEGYIFLGWSSDVEGIGGSEQTLTFTVPERDEVLLIANFYPKALLTTLVNETLNATLDAKVDARIEAKIDGEKLLTAEQATAKTVTTINQKVEDGELITSDQLQEMALSAPVIEVKNGAATVGISVMKASAVDGEWENVELEEGATSVEADTVKVTVPADEKAAFYKFVVPEKQATE